MELQLSHRDLMFLHHRSKERARSRGIEHYITLDDVKAIYADSAGRCQVSNIPFNDFRPIGSTKRPWYPSIDRIDSRKPYTKDNCRIVCVAVNMAMGEWGLSVLKAIAGALVNGDPGPICEGPEADPYSFKRLTGALTPKQLARRRQRAKHWQNHERITNSQQAAS
jgi:hypothetical protein